MNEIWRGGHRLKEYYPGDTVLDGNRRCMKLGKLRFIGSNREAQSACWDVDKGTWEHPFETKLLTGETLQSSALQPTTFEWGVRI